MQSVMSNIFNLIENFIDIVNKKCCLIMGAKYYNSSMNDACTICPANIVGHPTKVVLLITFFLEKKLIFVQLLCWPLASQFRSQLMMCIWKTTYNTYIYILV